MSVMSTTEIDELVARTRGLQPWRRAFHAASGLLVALAPPALGLGPHQTAVGLGLGALILLGLDVLRLRVAALNAWFFRTFSRLASPREARGLASSTWFAVGAALAWAAFPAPFATAALLVLGLADPVASMVGRLAGGRRFGKGSVEGFSTFVTVAFLVLWPAVGAGPALVGAFVTAAAEVLPIPPDDNLVIPLVCGSVLWAMSVL